MKTAKEIKSITLNSIEGFKKQMNRIEADIVQSANDGLYMTNVHNIPETIIERCADELILNGFKVDVVNGRTILNVDWA